MHTGDSGRVRNGHSPRVFHAFVRHRVVQRSDSTRPRIHQVANGDPTILTVDSYPGMLLAGIFRSRTCRLLPDGYGTWEPLRISIRSLHVDNRNGTEPYTILHVARSPPSSPAFAYEVLKYKLPIGTDSLTDRRHCKKPYCRYCTGTWYPGTESDPSHASGSEGRSTR